MGQFELVDQQIGGVALLEHLVAGEALGVAAEQDVDTTARHVGRDGDRTEPAGLGHDLGLTGVLLGVQDLVRRCHAASSRRDEVLALLDADGADEDRLALVVTRLDVVDDCAELASSDL